MSAVPGPCSGLQAGRRAGCTALDDVVTVLGCTRQGTDFHRVPSVGALAYLILPVPFLRTVKNTGLNQRSWVQVTVSYDSSGTMDKLHGLSLGFLGCKIGGNGQVNSDKWI